MLNDVMEKTVLCSNTAANLNSSRKHFKVVVSYLFKNIIELDISCESSPIESINHSVPYLPKILDVFVYANSVDPDQTPPLMAQHFRYILD